MIAAPRFVCRYVKKAHMLDARAVFGELRAHEHFFVGIAHVDADLLGIGERINQPGEHRRDGVVGFGERDAFAPWPGEPGGGVRLPLGWHPVAHLSRSVREESFRFGHGD